MFHNKDIVRSPITGQTGEVHLCVGNTLRIRWQDTEQVDVFYQHEVRSLKLVTPEHEDREDY